MYTYVPSFPPKVEEWMKGLSVTLTCNHGLMYLLHSVSESELAFGKSKTDSTAISLENSILLQVEGAFSFARFFLACDFMWPF